MNAIRLTEDDAVAGLVVADDDHDLLTLTENGYGKRTPMADYRTQSRYGKGLKDIKTNERNGRVTAIEAVTADDDLVVMSQGGQIIRTRVGDISAVGRNTMGVRVMQLDDGDHVACLDVLSDHRVDRRCVGGAAAERSAAAMRLWCFAVPGVWASGSEPRSGERVLLADEGRATRLTGHFAHGFLRSPFASWSFERAKLSRDDSKIGDFRTTSRLSATPRSPFASRYVASLAPRRRGLRR